MLMWMAYALNKKLKTRRSLAVQTEEFDAGLTEPASGIGGFGST